ncbi:hypothetical protein [Shouchella lonarensis]|uniref:Uncharacterized protein n=1 Tax=Shouchella lonarensis TaxID=1464122 RepID=A0A1G6HGP9_9BACI|nr:hypothetical protein [Shouchella lonarensis]SDB92626.1 hypothetical protein SAMN05421737_103245 [Shouchella lonarensis]
MEAEKPQSRAKPAWLKWFIRIVLAYIALLALILSITIITVTGTFTLIVLEGFTGNAGLREFSERFFIPTSEFLWHLFIWLVPGLS